MAIRRATAADAEAIAAIHVAAYDETYRGLAPPEVFEGLNLERRTGQWRRFFAEPPPDAAAFVIEPDGEPVGFGSNGIDRSGILPIGWIKAVYLLKRAQAQGLGLAMMATLAEDLAAKGAREVRLDVAVGNDRAEAFYQRLGASFLSSQVDPGPIWKSPTRTYGWNDVAALASAAGRVARHG
ncbi:MAG: GNAT family N-acetyltransferase [Phreatobacter sp.]|uniref:GNAT family N-acetyltransferase n=1 Tax=Phreatobacter sp. TaxID=1966341 RepID=UPI00273365CB|nr:GNAT family N-acetyltransferase [Phreatobacter sp.]MDP2803523.1 GNAT family N-acetyltransferase [Phreatobacter sp.]